MHETPYRQRAKLGLLLLAAFFLLACSCNPFSRGGGEGPQNPNFAGAEFGEVVTAGAIGQGNEPRDIRSEFSQDDPILYVVAKVDRVEAGTTVFARWFRDNEAIEDSATITADRLYEDTYLEFHLEPEQGTSLEALETGDYSVQIYVNGNPGPTAEFTVR